MVVALIFGLYIVTVLYLNHVVVMKVQGVAQTPTTHYFLVVEDHVFLFTQRVVLYIAAVLITV